VSFTQAELLGLMEDAVEFGIRHVESGGLPFVGVLIGNDGYVSKPGVNLVHETGDPSAHAEIVAMRAALRDRGLSDLQGTWLLATGEPCGLCYRFAIDHQVETIFVAVDRDAVADWGFDYRTSYQALGISDDQRAGLIHHLPVERGVEPFARYLQANTNSEHTHVRSHNQLKGTT
jgi:tRNA(Arg) A34 adenosine deaminase TadA